MDQDCCLTTCTTVGSTVGIIFTISHATSTKTSNSTSGISRHSVDHAIHLVFLLLSRPRHLLLHQNHEKEIKRKGIEQEEEEKKEKKEMISKDSFVLRTWRFFFPERDPSTKQFVTVMMLLYCFLVILVLFTLITCPCCNVGLQSVCCPFCRQTPILSLAAISCFLCASAGHLLRLVCKRSPPSPAKRVLHQL